MIDEREQAEPVPTGRDRTGAEACRDTDASDEGEVIDDSDEDGLQKLLASTSTHRTGLSTDENLCDLLDKMNYAIDELYYLCELESTTQGCSEAISSLRDRAADFEELMERIHMQERFGEGSIKYSIAWEVQTSPLHASTHRSARRSARNSARTGRTQRRGSHRRPRAVPARTASKHSSSTGDSTDSDQDNIHATSRVSGEAADRLTVDVPSDEDEDGDSVSAPSSCSSASAPASAESSLRSKRSPSKRFAAFEKRLLTPERRKKTAEETLRDQIEKQERAEKQRSMLLSEKQDKLREASIRAAKVSAAQEVEEEQRLKRRLFMDERHEKAEQLHKAHVQGIQKIAGKESIKVKEVRFINDMMQANRFLDYNQKLEDSESRRESRSSQRAAKTALDVRQAAAQEKRRSMEAERKLKLKEKEDRRLQTQRRRALAKEKAQERKEAKAEELARRAEEVQHREQHELERLEQELKKRLNEVNRRKKQYLEKIKEKAAEKSAKVTIVTNSSGKALGCDRSGQTVSSPPSVDSCSGQLVEEIQDQHNVLCPLIPILHRTRASKKRLRKLRQKLSSAKTDENVAIYGAQSDWDRQSETLACQTRMQLAFKLQHARQTVVHDAEVNAEHALQSLSTWLSVQDGAETQSMTWCRAGVIDFLVEVAMKAQSPRLRASATSALAIACDFHDMIWRAVICMHHVAPFVDALASTLGSAAGQALLAEPVAVTSYKTACAHLLAQILEQAHTCQEVNDLYTALTEYIFRSRVVQLAINSLLVVISWVACITDDQLQCSTCSRFADYVTECFQLLKQLSYALDQHKVSSKPALEPLLGDIDCAVKAIFTSHQGNDILRKLGCALSANEIKRVLEVLSGTH